MSQNSYIPAAALSHFSLLNSISKPEHIIERCVTLSSKACVLTDLYNISGAMSFTKAAKKSGVKPVLGMKVAVRFDDSQSPSLKHQTLIAKNIKGWKTLIKLTSVSANKGNIVNEIPTLSVEELEQYCDDNLISYTGETNSTLEWYYTNKDGANDYISRMKGIFKDSFFLSSSIVCHRTTDNHMRDFVRELAQSNTIKIIAVPNANYCERKDAVDHRILLASMAKSTINKINKLIQLGKIVDNNSFFVKDYFHIPTFTESVSEFGSLESELGNTLLIEEMCETYEISNKPMLPKFPTPNGETDQEYLLKLCRDGWKRRVRPEWDKQIYGDRVKRELQVFREANLEGYFLIVQDYVNWAKNQGYLVGCGRGSVGGSLCAYLLGITNIDPIPYDLLFERFYNAGRNTKDKVSYPDIDIDFPVHQREKVIDYIVKKYGRDRVAHISTFGRLQGRGAIKEVLRINEACSFEEINNITENIPQEFQIADLLEEDEETSILNWTLDNEPDRLADWVFKDEATGKLSGQFASQFEQAIRLEGVYKSKGRHAAGIVISPEPLDMICPLSYDPKKDEKVAAINMKDVEDYGLVKKDILGLLTLDRLQGLNNLLRFGKVEV